MLTADDSHSSLNLPSFLLNDILTRRIVGRYKHFLIIQLQAEIHRRTGSWLPIGLLWQRLDELYDLEGLDEIVRVVFPFCQGTCQLTDLWPQGIVELSIYSLHTAHIVAPIPFIPTVFIITTVRSFTSKGEVAESKKLK